ncbi:MAG: hypothetical protein HRT88_23970, partial [Lentisphaeraceae bacterium]|nr:hypothetical protein [Lentisphaeraceae bacterium]
MKIQNKFLMMVTGIALLAITLMAVSIIFYLNYDYKQELDQRFSLAGNLAQLHINQFAEDVAEGLDGCFNEQEDTSNMLLALSSSKPLRSNFFNVIERIAVNARVKNIVQTELYFVSQDTPDLRLYGVQLNKGKQLYSVSSSQDVDRRIPIEVKKGEFGLFEYQHSYSMESFQKLLTVALQSPDSRINFAIVTVGGKHYLKVERLIINRFIGKDKDVQPLGREKDFIFKGMTFGVVRAYKEIPQSLIDGLMWNTGMSVSCYPMDLSKGIGFYKKPMTNGKALNSQLFERNVSEMLYLNRLRQISINNIPVGYLVLSVPDTVLKEKQQASAILIFVAGIALVFVASFITLPFVNKHFV